MTPDRNKASYQSWRSKQSRKKIIHQSNFSTYQAGAGAGGGFAAKDISNGFKVFSKKEEQGLGPIGEMNGLGFINPFLFEAEWELLAPVNLRVEGFRKIASEFSDQNLGSGNNDFGVKLLLLFAKVLPSRVRNRPVHDFLANFSQMKGTFG